MAPGAMIGNHCLRQVKCCISNQHLKTFTFIIILFRNKNVFCFGSLKDNSAAIFLLEHKVTIWTVCIINTRSQQTTKTTTSIVTRNFNYFLPQGKVNLFTLRFLQDFTMTIPVLKNFHQERSQIRTREPLPRQSGTLQLSHYITNKWHK